eukprot:COSAG04_NODE_789_length_10269_cov_17.022745_2_plen_101_part_00
MAAFLYACYVPDGAQADADCVEALVRAGCDTSVWAGNSSTTTTAEALVIPIATPAGVIPITERKPTWLSPQLARQGASAVCRLGASSIWQGTPPRKPTAT